MQSRHTGSIFFFAFLCAAIRVFYVSGVIKTLGAKHKAKTKVA